MPSMNDSQVVQDIRRARERQWTQQSEVNWIPGRLGVKDGSGGFDIAVEGRPGYKYVSLGVNGDQGQSIALDKIGVTSINFQNIKMRREYGALVIREADSASGVVGGTNTLDSLDDVNITSLADGELIQWDALDGVWRNVTLSGAGGAPSPHDLNSAHHTGQLADAQFLNALLRDGSRSLTGNLSVSSGVTIDGVDISVHAADPDAHHNRVTVGNTGLSLSTQVLSLNLATDPGLEISSGVRVKVDSTLVRDADGVGVNLTHDFPWTGIHSFTQDLQIAANIDFVGGDRLITGSGDLTLSPADDLFLNPTGDVWLSAGGVMFYEDDQEVRSISFSDLVTGIQGFRWWERTDATNYWQLTMGAAKFDELYARVFVADEVRIDRGEEYWSKSYGVVETDFVLPALGATVDVWFEDAPALLGANLFSVGDWLLFRIIDWGSGLLIMKVWLQVQDAGALDYVSKDTVNDRQQWRLMRKKFGTTGVKVKKGNVALDAGQVGQGWLHLSALSQDGGPFFQVGDFTSIVSDEPQFTNRVRMGNLDGTVDYSSGDVWGFAAGNNLGIGPDASFSGLTADATNGLRLFNTDIELYNGSTLAVSMNQDYGLTFLQDTGLLDNLERIVSWHSVLDATPDDPIAYLASYDSGDGHLFEMLVKQTGADLADIATLRLVAYQETSTHVASVTLNAPGGAGESSVNVFATKANLPATLIGASADDTPVAMLEVNSVDRNPIDLAVYGTAYSHIVGRRALGTRASPTGLVEGNVIFSISGIGYADAGGGNPAGWTDIASGQLSLRAIDDFTEGDIGNAGAEWVFLTVPHTVSGALEQRMRINGDGVWVDTQQQANNSAMHWRTESGIIVTAGVVQTENYFVISVDETLFFDRVLEIDLTTGEIFGNIVGTVGGASSGSVHDPATGGDGIGISGSQVINVDATVVRTSLALTAGAGLTGGGTLAANRTFNVGAGPGITVAADNIEIALASPSGLQLTSDVLAVADSIAGDGLVISSKILAVGAGDGISVTVNAVALAGTVAGAGLTFTTGVVAVGAGAGIAVAADAVAINLGSNSALNTSSGLVVDSSIAGAGLTMTSGVVNVIAGDGISVAADAVAVASTIAGAGLTFTTGVVAVGAGAGISVAADAVAINLGSDSALSTASGGLVVDPSIAGAGLTMTTGVVNVIALSTGGLTVNANDIQIKLPSPSGLVTDATGLYIDDAVAGAGLTMTSKVLNVIAGDGSLTVAANELHVNLAHSFVWSGSHTWNTGVFTFNTDPQINGDIDFIGADRLITAAANLTIIPVGDLILSPTGSDVLPGGSVLVDLGDYNRKWRTLYVAEMVADVLVQSNVMATIGGRIMVAPTTKLIADMTAVQTTIDVADEIYDSGDFAVMQTAPAGTPQFEAIKIVSGHSVITGGFRYTIERNKDGSGANAWLVGDAVVNAGSAAGEGWIDLSAVTTTLGHIGPTITIYARSATTNWNDAKATVTMGNLDSFVGYGVEYGFAAGNDLTLTASTGFSGFTADRTNGLRLFNTDIDLYDGSNKVFSIDKTDGITLEKAAGSSEWFSAIRWYDDLASPSNALASVRLIRDGSNLFNALSLAAGDGGNASHRGFISLTATKSTGELAIDIDPSIGIDLRTTIGGTAYIAQFSNGGDMVLYGDMWTVGATRIDGLLDARANASVDGNLDVVGTLDARGGVVTIEQQGAGDALLNFSLLAGQLWVMGIDNSDGDKFKISENAALGSADAFVINNVGNVGIGMSAIEAWHTDYVAIQLGAAASLMNIKAGYNLWIAGNAWWDGTNWKRIIADEASYYNQDDGVHTWGVGANSTAGSNITWVNAMTLALSGALTVPYIWATAVAGTAVHINSNGILTKTSSSLRLKENIREVPSDYGDNFVMAMRPILYDAKQGDNRLDQLGFAAEHIEQIGGKPFVSYNDDGLVESLHYERLVVPLAMSLQSLIPYKKRIEELEEKVRRLEMKLH